MNLKEKLELWRKNYLQYAVANLKIKNKESEIVPFTFNRMQRKMWELLLFQLQSGKPIRWLVVKDRQIGFSTFVAGLFFWICTLFPNKDSLTVSHDIDSAANIFDKHKLFYKLLSQELRPLRKISNRREMYFANPDESGDLGLESRIVIDTADSAEIGRSYTFRLAHLSEMAAWEQMGLDIKTRMSSLNQSIPELAGTIIMIETTPRGEGYVSRMWENKDNGYTKIFISSVADEKYRIELNLDEYFQLEDYEEHKYGDETLEYEYYENEVKFWYPELENKLDLIHHEVMCRLAWRRETIDKKCESDKNIFDQEYPITIEKAFASSGANVFDIYKINKVKKILKENPPKFYRYRYDVNADDFYQINGGPLKIFEEPQEKFKYILGADVALGISKDGDLSAISIRRIPDLKQVATYEAIIEPKEFAKIILKLAKIYNNAFCGVEVNERGGYAVVEYLINVFYYRNLYMREVMLEPGKPKTKKYGWSSNPKTTRPTMEADYKELFNNDELEILDETILESMRKYVLDSKTGLTGVRAPGHDDLLLADMICIQMARFVHQTIEKPKQRKKYTFDWWANLVEPNYDDVIGHVRRG